jgi:hypothetical protein
MWHLSTVEANEAPEGGAAQSMQTMWVLSTAPDQNSAHSEGDRL